MNSRLQDVDFFLPEFLPKQVLLSFNSLCAVVAIYIVMLGLLYGVSLNQVPAHQAVLEKLLSSNSDFDRKLESLRTLQRKASLSSVNDRLLKIKERDKYLSDLLLALKNQKPNGETGFSRQFIALGEHLNEDVSLNHIIINRETGDVALSGKSRVAESVPRYIAALSGDTLFQQNRFGMIVIYAEESEPYLNFNVGNVYEADLLAANSIKPSNQISR